ncbi:MAG: hypothetical protein V7K88_00480 [Nostoc sp.]|uniref:hypothetical protein n=1 Tax=Nostoc sp. TaxID=1180 RepID=UPI002FF9EB4B
MWLKLLLCTRVSDRLLIYLKTQTVLTVVEFCGQGENFYPKPEPSSEQYCDRSYPPIEFKMIIGCASTKLD